MVIRSGVAFPAVPSAVAEAPGSRGNQVAMGFIRSRESALAESLATIAPCGSPGISTVPLTVTSSV